MSIRQSIYDLNYQDLAGVVKNWGCKNYRTRQIWHGLYQSLWDTPESFLILPKELRAKLAEHFSFHPLEVETTVSSTDGRTQKTLFNSPEGDKVEAVLMLYRKRRTLCISTQAGCAMGCVFCATGQMGFQRNLTEGEIIAQILHFSRILKQNDQRPTNIVMMGMGEPFHNYSATMNAIERLHHPEGYNMGARRFTISTVGLVPKIREFARVHSQVNLAVSLHAADNELRSSLLPINKKYPLEDLIPACREYVDLSGRRVTFEWAFIDGVNDSTDQARKLARLLKGLICHVNVIPLNPTRGYDGRASARNRMADFIRVLEDHKVPVTIRERRGIDIQAGCGQLARAHQEE